MSDPLLTQLAARLARPVSEAERGIARLHLLDWLACIAGGRDSEAAAMGGAISMRGWERATYAGASVAMVDAHCTATISPGPAVWPAALSMPSASMEQRLDAAVRGYEAALAIGAALDQHHFDHWHAASTCGVFGACAGFGSVIGFAAVEYANALGNAGSVAGGLLHFQHQPDLLTPAWHIYHAVRTGRDAALHVHYGATGPQGLLEGPQGMFAAMTQAASDLGANGDGWMITSLTDETSGAEAINQKLQTQLVAGGLNDAQGDRATAIALEGDDVDAIDTLLEKWTR